MNRCCWNHYLSFRLIIGFWTVLLGTHLSPIHRTWADEEWGENTPSWIRVRATFGDKQSTIWYSPLRKIWIREHGETTFLDARNRVKYFVSNRRDAITAWPLGEESPDPAFPLSQLTDENRFLGRWFFKYERIVDQSRREVTDNGKVWTELQFGLVGNRFNRGTVRIDPATKRPIYLLIETPGETGKPTRWDFDYPENGPTTVAELVSPNRVDIRSQLPSEDCAKTIAAIKSSRALIKDLRLVVANLHHENDQHSLRVVYRKGDFWRIDTYFIPFDLAEASKDVVDDMWGEWIDLQLASCDVRHSLVSTGNSVFERQTPKAPWILSERIGPLDLLVSPVSPLQFDVCFAHRFYPDLTPNRDEDFEYDAKPAEAADWVLVKKGRSDSSGDFSQSRFYIQPSRGYCISKYEIFDVPKGKTLASDAVASRSRAMEDFRQSPQGWWYPAISRNFNQGTAIETVRYHFDFNADLPDALFEINQSE